MVVLARRPGTRLAAVLGLCACPGDHTPTLTTAEPTPTSQAADSQPDDPTTTVSEPTTTTSTPASTSSTSATTTTTGSPDDETTDPGSSGGSTTTGSLEQCGDGQVQPGEQCDLSFSGNLDTGDCTSQCRLPVCGDGFVWTDHENCDSGDANNDTTWNGCRTDCTLGPRCNDGTLQPDHEECDDGPEWNGSGEASDPDHAPCSSECRVSGRLFFLTSAKYTGKLGGLAGADEICRTAALTAGLDNHTNFIAWLSDATQSPASRIPHVPAPDPNPDPDLTGTAFVMPDGTLVADDWDDLITNGPRLGVYIDELGVHHETDARVWTNTDGAAGVASTSDHCAGWFSEDTLHSAGYGKGFTPKEPEDLWMAWKTGKWWTLIETEKCNKTRRLYCVEK